MVATNTSVLRLKRHRRFAFWPFRIGTLAVLCLLAPHATSFAQDGVTLAGHVYTDDDGLLVVHPSVTGHVQLTEDLRIDAGYDVDVITAATIDVRTSASIRPFREVRHGAHAGFVHALSRTLSVGAAYVLSYSPDYQSHTFSSRLSVEDEDKTHTLSIALGGSYAAVQRAGDAQVRGEIGAFGLTGTWSFVLSRRLVGDVGAAVDWQHGFLISPYRTVQIDGTQGLRIFVPEAVPDDRIRLAINARLRMSLMDDLFARAAYRLHTDSWGLAGHTVNLRATWVAHPAFRVTLGQRVFVQRGASFYSGYYRSDGVPRYRTRDRSLSPMFASTTSLSVRWRVLDSSDLQLSIGARGELQYYRYFNTPLLPERTGFVAGLSLIGER